MRCLVFHLALCPSKYPRNEQGRLQRMRRFPLASFPCFYAHNKAAPISTKVEELTQESTRIFRLQPQMLSQRRRLPECWDLCCRSNERTYNRSPHRCSRRPVNKKFIKQKESKFNDTNTRTRFHEGNIPYKVGRWCQSHAAAVWITIQKIKDQGLCVRTLYFVKTQGEPRHHTTK